MSHHCISIILPMMKSTSFSQSCFTIAIWALYFCTLFNATALSLARRMLSNFPYNEIHSIPFHPRHQCYQFDMEQVDKMDVFALFGEMVLCGNILILQNTK